MKVESLDFEKPLWRVMPDHGRQGLALEIRSREEKEVQFFYLDLSNGKQIRLQTEHDWWKGLQEVQNGVLLLHAYENPGLPLPQGLFAYEAEKGQLLWEKPQDTFEALAGDIIRLKNQQGLQTYISLSSGEVVPKKPSPSIFTLETDSKNQDLSFPKVFIDGHEAFATHHATIKQHWEIDAQVQIDKLNIEENGTGYQVFNFYHKNPTGNWNQDVGILTKNSPSFHKQIGTNLQGLSLDPFFMFRDYLIWIENATRLSYLRLG